ncbi:hypothetical protein ABEG17_12790 [Pedococcus sp. KACC 23699]|uniref:LPXTG cell wall anchor domain-containing protein n=1 Tax=Pedococcus sp. KACC 23699 TaxID=3149228 RepID=A0AAU7JPV6_9MICO
MLRRALCAVLCVFALWPLAACKGGQGAANLPSATTSPSPTRTLPSSSRTSGAPEQTASGPGPSQPTSASRPPRSTSPQTTAQSTTQATTVPKETQPSASPLSSPSSVASAGQPAQAQDNGATTTWLLVGLLVVAAAVATWLVVRARRRRQWLTRLAAAEAEVAWFARELVPQLRTSRTVGEVVGGWHISAPRAASAEDQLTVLSSSAANQEDAARAQQLRDATRAASHRLEALAGPGSHDQWALDLDGVEAILVAALGPSTPDHTDSAPPP